MTTYIFSRDNGGEFRGLPRELMVGQMFFDLWRTRQHPYRVLAEGDTVLLFDTKGRRLMWELRVAALTRTQYSSIPQALDVLRERYGLLGGELNAYIWQRPPSGWLLAWAAEPVRALDVAVPAGFRMTDYGGRNGYVDLAAVSVALRPDLPDSVDVEPVALPAAYVGGVDDVDVVSRYIPVTVRRDVWERDGGRCVTCGRGADEIPIHFDHRYPHSRGGTNSADNLQLLCRDHNLSKGARVLDGIPVPKGVPLRSVAADIAGLPRTAPLSDLLDAVDEELALRLALEEAARGDLDEVLPLLDGSRPCSDLIAAEVALRYFDDGDLPRAHACAERLLDSDDLEARRIAAVIVAEGMADGPDRTALLERAADDDGDLRPYAQFLLGTAYEVDERADLARAAYDIAYRHGAPPVRTAAALALFELNAFDSDDDAEGLLRVALGGAGDTRAAAALHLVAMLDGYVSGEVLTSLAQLALDAADDPRLRDAATHVLGPILTTT